MKVRRLLDEDAKPAPPVEPGDPVEPKMAALAEALAAYPAATPKVIVVPPEWSPPEFVRPSPTECEREARWVSAQVPNATLMELDPDWATLRPGGELPRPGALPAADRGGPRGEDRRSDQPSWCSLTLRMRKSRKTEMRFEARSSSG